ncbi:MAG: hypothetical protein ACYCZ2_01780 [Lutibacter sp.]
MKKVKVAINGNGVIGKRVADAVHLQDDMELIGVCDFITDWQIKIFNWKLATGSNTKTLNSQIEIKAYLLGINVKTNSYKVKEVFDENKNLTRREFKATDGSYFTTSYK